MENMGEMSGKGMIDCIQAEPHTHFYGIIVITYKV